MNSLTAFVLSLFSVSRPALLAAVLGLSAMPLQAHAATEAAGPDTAGGTLQVGMHYVVPPFVGGYKVLTPEAIDTALAEALAPQLARALQAGTVQGPSKEYMEGIEQPRRGLGPAHPAPTPQE